MEDTRTPETGGEHAIQPKKLDLDVKVYPTQREGNILATANITLGGCFAVKGLRVMDGKNGLFVAMPDRRDGQGKFQDICFPTTKEMREALNTAVMGEYQKAVERIAARGKEAMQRPSALNNLNQKKEQVAERPAPQKKPVDRDAR